MHHACKPGYTLTGTAQSTCQANGSWSTTNARCEPITCPDLLVPNHGTINGTEFYFSKSVKFSCGVGYILQGVEVITCGANGRWSHNEPQCMPVSCGKPNKIASGSWTYSGVVYESTVWYDCHIGYKLLGAKMQTCLSNGSWSNTPPVCQKVSCGVPENIENGSVSQVEVFYGDSATYVCNEGFMLVGKAKSACLFDSTFSAKPYCQIVSCGSPPRIKNGRIQTDSHIYKSIGKYHCNDGYDLVGDSEIQCLSTGSWSSLLPSCEPVSCGLPDGIENGWFEVQSDNTTYMAKVTYYCESGYDLVGSEIRTCLSTSEWSADNPSCQPVSCDHPPGLQNGYFVTNGTTYLSTAIYKCNCGFNLTGNDVKTCQANKTWSNTSQNCKRVFCGQPPRIEHGSYVGVNWTFESTVQYVCDKGYVINGTRGIVCEADTSWSTRPLTGQSTGPHAGPHTGLLTGPSMGPLMGPLTGPHARPIMGPSAGPSTGSFSGLPVCTPVKCNVPQIPINGNILTNTTDYEYQSIIQYTCNSGYELIGEGIQTCLEDGHWSGVSPHCLPVSCGDPPVIVLNGFLLKPSNGTFGSVVRYICEIGYELVSVDYIRCQADGHWSTPWPRCEPITCLYPNEPSNGGVLFEEVTYNAVATYSCAEGFDLVGSKILRCMPDKSWSSDVPKCDPVECGVPPSTEYGSWITDTNDIVTKFKFGAVIQYSCIEGYELVSDGIAMCTANGNWNVTTDSICQKVSCNVPSPVPNGQYHTTAYTYRSTITYQCNKGYEINGSISGICKADGQWSIAPPICELITCPILQAPEHGLVSGNNKYNDLLTFECHATHELIGVKQLQCTETGSWNHPAPFCRQRTCGRPPDLPNGVMFGQRYLKGDRVSYRCYSGYVLRGQRSRLCQDNYTWSGDPPKCLGECILECYSFLCLPVMFCFIQYYITHRALYWLIANLHFDCHLYYLIVPLK